ncbi:MAG: class I SAM-dependent methyltransferase [Spirochaetes bacterium]|nr:class I SAM-dependent methyltransferase [Spirochaetota bacterium]
MRAINFSSVSETLFLPLYARAIETVSRNPVINDPVSVAVVRVLDEQFRDTDSAMLRAMVRRALPKRLPVTIGLRTRAFDRYIAAFIGKHPDAVVINLGCGLDTRFARIDNGTIDWYNIDLPPVIRLREELLSPRPRERNIAASVLDHEWMNGVDRNNRPVIIYAEGLFMYLTEAGVKSLLLALQRKFPDSELVAEVFNFSWVKRLEHPYFRWKFKRQLHMDKDALFTYGIRTSRDFELFGPGFSYLDEWNYFDEKEKKQGWYNLAGKLKTVRSVQWTVHYRIAGV